MRNGKARLLLGLTVLVAGLTLGVSPASAEVTHKYLGSWPTGLSQPEVAGIDAQGRVYVWDRATNAMHRFDDEGNPAPFSALGTNVIDGKEGADAVPTGELRGSNGFNQGDAEAAVDPRATGTAAGYIYITNSSLEPQPGDVEVFNATGQWVGALNREITFPNSCVGRCLMGNVSVASNGNVMMSACCSAPASLWAPTDPNPLNWQFVGQLRNGWTFNAAGTPYSYGLEGTTWAKYDFSSLLQPKGETKPTDSTIFGPTGGAAFDSLSIDPYTQDVYLHGVLRTQQWSKDDVKIGPDFGMTGVSSLAGSMGFHPDGRLFVRGSEGPLGGNVVAVFSDEVPIPDVSYGPAVIDHEALTINATVGLGGGPPVEECVIEYGSGLDVNGNPTFGSTVPCEPATPYTDETAVSVELTGLPTETTFYYRVLATNENGTTPGATQSARTAAVLGVKPLPATDIDMTSATLNGELDPDGLPTTYYFQYGIDTEYDSQTPEQSAGSGNGTVALSAPLTQLQPGRVYHYRVVAKNSLGTTFSADATFQVAGPPTVGGLSADELSETTARINARVNPSGYETTYYFEYGTTPTYGQKTPATPQSIGDENVEIPVSAQLTGLTPGIVYHYRVVAENQWGTTYSDNATFNFFPPGCPNEHVRQQTGSNYLPDCRAYELVSPANAGAVQLFPSSVTMVMGEGYGLGDEPGFSVTPQNSGLASGPSRFSFFGGLGAIDGTDPPNSLIDMYVTTRTTTGWATTFPGLKGSEALTIARPQCTISMDRCIVRKAPELLGPGGGLQPPQNAPYEFAVDGTFLGRWPTNIGAVDEGWLFYGDAKASGEFEHFAFSSRERAYAPGALEEAPGSTYDNDIDARTVTIASRMPNGENIQRDAGDDEEWMMVPAVSRDGSHILMSTKASDGPTHLYMRVDGATTYDVTRGTGAAFVGMTSSGSAVIFVSSHRLTPDDTDSSADIYRWDEDGDTLTRLSKGNGNGNSDACNAAFTPSCDVQPLEPERGRTQFGEPGPDDYIAAGNGTAYFFSPEQLDPENPGIANQRNLYMADDEGVQYVATLDPGTTVNRSQISPDAAKAAFITEARLTGYDNAGVRQMYTYDAASGAIACASCNPSGAAPVGDVLGSGGGRFMADDGRAFYTTPDPLVLADTNGLHDVYEFVDGRPQLISNGTTDRDLYAGGAFFPPQFVGLEAVSSDGVDVYFSTFATMVKEDINGEFVKFYDARTNGGFAEQGALQPCTAADECAGTPSRPAVEPPMTTGVNLNRGQVPNQSKKKKRAKKRAQAKRRRAAKRKRARQKRRAAKRRAARAMRAEQRRGR